MVVPFFRSHVVRRLTGEKRKREEEAQQSSEEELSKLLEKVEVEIEEEDEEERGCRCCPEHPWLITHPLRNNVSGGVWKGWNAALIVSKKKGLRAFARYGSTDSAVEHPTAFCLNEMGEEETKLLKEGVDALTMHVLAQVRFVRLLEGFLGNDLYRRFVESLFRSAAKFVLSVFDKDDFERIYHDKEIAGQWQDFRAILRESGIGKEEVARRAIKKVIEESRKFPALRDHDFCQMLSQQSKGEEAEFDDPVNTYDGYGGLLHAPFKFKLRSVTVDTPQDNGIGKGVILDAICELMNKGNLQEDDISKSTRDKVINEVMQNFVHLKEECKTQLALELTCANSYLVFDTLVIEALKAIKIDPLLDRCDREPALERRRSPFSMLSSTREGLQRVLDHFVLGLYELGWLKSAALKYSEDALASCLLSAFGPCEAEVIEVIKIADNERRLNCRSSISLDDINYGLCVSGMGRFVERIHGWLPPKFSIIEFFEVLRQKANSAGDKEVGLEHLVLAIHTVLRRREYDLDVRDPFDKVVAEHLRCEKNREMEKKLGRRWEEFSPVSSILGSRYRILSDGSFAGAGDSIEFVRKLRNCSEEDISWIHKDTAAGIVT